MWDFVGKGVLMSANAVSWVLDPSASRCECPTVTKLSHKWIAVQYRDHAVYVVGNGWNMQPYYTHTHIYIYI